MTRYFIDTNIVVYANDRRDPAKQQTAIEIIRKAFIDRNGIISIQVLQEYASVALAKLGQSEETVLHQLALLGTLEVTKPNPSSVRRAVEIKKLYGISFWDASIIVSAEDARCVNILSEDLNAGQRYSGIKVINPFK